MELSAVVCRWPSDEACLLAATSDEVAAPRCQGTLAGKTLDGNIRCQFSIVSGSWQPLLEDVCLALPVSKVFSSKVLPALAGCLCWQCLHEIGLDSPAQFCALSWSVLHQQEKPTREQPRQSFACLPSIAQPAVPALATSEPTSIEWRS